MGRARGRAVRMADVPPRATGAGRESGLVNRAGPGHVALETTLLVHGIPIGSAPGLARELAGIVRAAGAREAFVGVFSGRPTLGLTDEELGATLAAANVPKVNTANLGIALHRGDHAATTVSATMELCAAAGVRVFATGGIGGVHRDLVKRLDISADLMAFTRFPVAVVSSGVKSLLDVESTREMLETLGVPVVGWRTERFPAFYVRESAAGVDARFDDVRDLAAFVDGEMRRTGRGVVVANPIPAGDEIDALAFDRWLEVARREAEQNGVAGRDVTPFVLGRLHELSGGVSLRAFLALVKDNARGAGELCAAMGTIR